MSERKGRPFYPIETSTAPSFNSSAFGAAVAYKLESTLRVWQGPSNRAVRVIDTGATVGYFVKFGTSDVVAASTDSFLIPTGLPMTVYVSPSQTHVGLFSTATATVNVTLGYGGS